MLCGHPLHAKDAKKDQGEIHCTQTIHNLVENIGYYFTFQEMATALQ